ncbi:MULTISPECIES: restriction endonuclease subunit S [Acetobacter]|jgi:type I restriction enzyme S subunit|uniref:restriction endonuclease subunit S n=1 Tax=Acetobacter TaxID=434 RepID=UPI00376FBC66
MLPQGWVEADIGELCNLVNGKAFKPSEWSKTGLPIIRIQNLNNSQALYNYYDREIPDKFLVNRGDLLFAWSGTPGTSFGAHLWMGQKAILNQHIFKIIFNDLDIDKNYFKIAINSTLHELIGKAQGGVGLAHVTKGKFETTKLPLPPLAEQRRIVAKLDSLTARIARARAELERVQVLKKQLKHKATQAIFSTNSTWPTAKLQDLVSDGPTNGWSPSTDSTAQGTLSLKLTATTSSYIRLDKAATKRIHETVPYDSKFWLKSGDILIQRANALEHLGVSAIFYGPEKKYIYPDLMMRVRVQDENLSRLIWYFLNSPNTRKHFRENATGTAGNMPKINGKIVKQLLVPFPPSDVRAHVVKSLDTLFARANRLESEAQRALTLLNRLESSLLAKAFRGELVPQDPTDEPASVLLDRIRAERAADPKPKRGRKQSTQDMPVPRKRQTEKHG